MKIRLSILLLISMIMTSACISQSIDNRDEQIGAAVMAVSEDMREEATVLGYDAEGKLVTLRKGTNAIICLADDPNRPGFNVACYHKDLEPFMARGRQLRAEGKSRQEIFDIREEEVKSGKLPMPENGATLHVLSGPEGRYNTETGQVENANYRYVVYVPFATAESTGLPTRPMKQGYPWLMDPGTHRAHIMISVPNN